MLGIFELVKFWLTSNVLGNKVRNERNFMSLRKLFLPAPIRRPSDLLLDILMAIGLIEVVLAVFIMIHSS